MIYDHRTHILSKFCDCHVEEARLCCRNKQPWHFSFLTQQRVISYLCTTSSENNQGSLFYAVFFLQARMLEQSLSGTLPVSMEKKEKWWSLSTTTVEILLPFYLRYMGKVWKECGSAILSCTSERQNWSSLKSCQYFYMFPGHLLISGITVR